MSSTIHPDFVVFSNKHCFFCLDYIHSNYHSAKNDLPPMRSCTNLTLNSLQCLSKYVKMDVRKVFNDHGNSAPQSLIEKVKKSELKVELCEKCAKFNDQFSKFYNELEKIEMTVNFCLSQLIGNFGKNSNEIQLTALMDNDQNTFCDGKLKVFKVLRDEVMQKGDKILKERIPKVKLKKYKLLTEKCVKVVPKLEISSESIPLTTFDLIKVENDDYPDFGISDDGHHDEDDNNYDDDDFNYLNERPDMDKRSDNKTYQTLPSKSSFTTNSLSSRQSSTSTSKSGVKVKTSKKDYFCNICHINFSSNNSLTAHHERFHLKMIYTCKICPRNFTHKTTYSHHMTQHKKGISMKCPRCNATFATYLKFKKHLDYLTDCVERKEKKEKLYQNICKLCKKRFCSQKVLRGHIERVHLKVKNKRKYSCDECGKELTTNYILQQHVEKFHK